MMFLVVIGFDRLRIEYTGSMFMPSAGRNSGRNEVPGRSEARLW